MLRFSALALGACLVASTGHAQAVELAEDVSAPEGSETPRGFDDSASVAPARSTFSLFLFCAAHIHAYSINASGNPERTKYHL